MMNKGYAVWGAFESPLHMEEYNVHTLTYQAIQMSLIPWW